MAGVLEHSPGLFPINTIVEDGKAFGVPALPPDIRYSSFKYSLESLEEGKTAIRVPFTQIKEFSPESAARLVFERAKAPFTSLDDLFRRVHLSPEGWDNLARSGALEVFGSRCKVFTHLGRLARLMEAPGKKGKQLSILDKALPLYLPVEEIPAFPLTEAEEIHWDFTTQSLTTGRHPMALRRPDLARLGAKPIGELLDMKAGSKVLAVGQVVTRQPHPQPMVCLIILEDESGRIPTAIPPQIRQKYEKMIQLPMMLVKGVLQVPPEEKSGKVGKYRSVLIERLWSLNVVSGHAEAVTVGAMGFPGENPRFAMSR